LDDISVAHGCFLNTVIVNRQSRRYGDLVSP
jgi:hypothetical protein